MTGISRTWFYSGLSARSNPCIEMIFKVITVLGCRLAVVGDGHVIAFDGDHRQLARAIDNAARAKKVRMSPLKSDGRDNSMRRSLLKSDNPTLRTLIRMMSALGYRLAAVPMEQLSVGGVPVLTWGAGGRELELRADQTAAFSASSLDLVNCLTYLRKNGPLSGFIIYRKRKSGTDGFRELNAALAAGNLETIAEVLGDAVCNHGVKRLVEKSGLSRQKLLLLKKHVNIRLANANRLLVALGCHLVVMDGDRVLTPKVGDSGQILQILGRVVACQGWTSTAGKADLSVSYLHGALRNGANPGLRNLLRIVSAVSCRLAVVPLQPA